MSLQKTSHRLKSIDALRGIAVLLMIQQHVLYWLSADIADNATVLALGALGGLAAPVFITLSGVGVSLSAKRHFRSGHLMPLRGLVIIAFGYLLNFLTPHWFSLGAWYVLHLIGLAIMISPLLQRCSSKFLLGLTAGVVFSTALLQTHLGTPLRLFNQQMGHPENLDGFLRHIFVEGFFPIFPWIAYFIAGIVAGRWLLQRNIRRIAYLAAILFTGFAALAICYYVIPTITRNVYLLRFFTVSPSFYPSLTPITLLLMSLALLLLFAITSLEKHISLTRLTVLSYLGQCSMSLLIVHVAVIRESARYYDFWRIFPMPQAVFLTWAVLVFFASAAYLWHKIDYRYGAEWMMRHISAWILKRA